MRLIYTVLFFFLVSLCNAQRNSFPRIDSLAQVVKAYERQNEDLKKELTRTNERLQDYNDMFKQQWSVFSVIIGLISLFFAVALPLLAFISFNRFKNTVNEKISSSEERISEVLNKINNTNEDVKKLKVELSEKIADTYLNKYYDLSTDMSHIGISWNALKEYVNCYRQTHESKYDEKIQEAASKLMIHKNDEGKHVYNFHRFFALTGNVDFQFLLESKDLSDESHIKLIRLHDNLKEYFESCKIEIEKRSME